jgi:CII-binding regulator of phage lambda lysogenization HflD
MEMDKDKFKFKMEEVEENGQKRIKVSLDVSYDIERRWSKIKEIVKKYDHQFENIILPKNNISQEMIRKIRDQINYIKISQFYRERSKENVRILLADLNCLSLDILDALKLSGFFKDGDEVTIIRRPF